MPAPTPASGESKSRRRAGRPMAAILDHAGITLAALELINRKGYDGLTMAALARSLGVAPSALYNHVASKDDVLRLVEEEVMSKVDFSGFRTLPWEDAVRQWAYSYRGIFARHTPLISVIAVLPVTDAPQTLSMYEAVTEGFLRAGFPEERIIPCIVALEAYVFGAAFDATAPADIFDSGQLADSTPHFSSAVRSLGGDSKSNYPSDLAFSMGLDALIAGFGALRV
ncbi:TetR/AcrR family transcriptional regulator [Arthrobacter sp. CJ23]|uniref:TetR/AcrR family transcriptional regulator n=1 Tax=Arthrobacter sp. CJ23 TaxID=2972479 RepID=UPI00215D3259|nr:TetR/AcrR family transcriptional regulator [Arthrobacter sp. CJ23]UVJ39657.1 TetR/AcrR family transcriptional regulator [Arthrobacter sp. CJ23]